MSFHEYTFIVAAGSRAQLATASFQSVLRIAEQWHTGTLGTGAEERESLDTVR